jgi:glycosyltransferase involved in cell wall biosynthesis
MIPWLKAMPTACAIFRASSFKRMDLRWVLTVWAPLMRLKAHSLVVSPAEPRSGATLDKAVYEAAACSRPVVTTNAALAPFLDGLPLELLAPPRDPAGLAAVLRGAAQAAPELRAAVGAELRRRVVEQHSLEHWADAVISSLREVRSSRGG